jgi:hypothetical protein
MKESLTGMDRIHRIRQFGFEILNPAHPVHPC